MRSHACQTLRLLGACRHNTRQVPKGAEGTAAVHGGRIGARGRRQGLAGLRDRPLRATGSRVAISRAGRRPPGTWTIGSAAVTREALHPLGGNAPNQKGYNANRWGRAPLDNKYKCGLAARNNDLDSNASRTRAACSARGRGCPDSEQQAHVRMRRPHQGTQSTNPSNTTRPISPFPPCGVRREC